MKKYKLVIFDLIDTLASSEKIVQADTLLVERMGAEMLDALIGNGIIDTEKTVEEVITRIKQNYTISPEQEIYINDWLGSDEIILLPETKETLNYLKEKGYKIGIISNSPPSQKRGGLQSVEIDEYFDLVLFSFDCGYRKPSREIYDLFLEKIDIAPEDTVMVGDSLKNDALGATNAGIDAILIDLKGNSSFKPKISNLLELKDLL